MRRVLWQDLRDVFKLAGYVESRIKGDHLVITRLGFRATALRVV